MKESDGPSLANIAGTLQREQDLVRQALKEGKSMDAWEILHRILARLVLPPDDSEKDARTITTTLDFSNLCFSTRQGFNELPKYLESARSAADRLGDLFPVKRLLQQGHALGDKTVVLQVIFGVAGGEDDLGLGVHPAHLVGQRLAVHAQHFAVSALTRIALKILEIVVDTIENINAVVQTINQTITQWQDMRKNRGNNRLSRIFCHNFLESWEA